MSPQSALRPGLILAAPRSGAGKTTLALGLMRALTRAGIAVQPFKNGPDYIDPAFHEVATGRPSFNLDSWAMSEALLRGLAGEGEATALAILEGSMGLFDGAANPGASGNGASADIAALTGWPVVLVLDVTGQGQSAAAVAKGCAAWRPDIQVAGVILNRVASPRHEQMVREAFANLNLPILGALARDPALSLPERHLGLVQAGETAELGARLDRLADAIERTVDLEALHALATRPAAPGAPVVPDAAAEPGKPAVPPPGQRIAIAYDAAFSFLYPHLLKGWRRAGAEIHFFSPLADQGPGEDCDCCWLPGGYPELHGERLAAAENFRAALTCFARDHAVHGECGGYMVLGQGIEDQAGNRHAMLGLLAHATSFARRHLHLGYRAARLLDACALGPAGSLVRGHEFHYSTLLPPEPGATRDAPLAEIHDATGARTHEGGSRRGRVSGTFFHAIARESSAAGAIHTPTNAGTET